MKWPSLCSSYVGRRAVLWIFLVLLCLSDPLTCQAGTGEHVMLPSHNRKKAKHGIVARVDWRWTEGYGYRPVRIDLTAVKMKRDRTIEVVLCPDSYSDSQTPLRVRVEIEIPAGETDVSKVVNLPQNNPWSMFRVEFYENGRILKDLSMKRGLGNYGYNSHESPNILLIDRDAPRLSEDRALLARNLRQVKDEEYKLPDASAFQFTVMQRNYNAVSAVQKRPSEDSDKKIVYKRVADGDSLEAISNASNLEMLCEHDLPTDYVGLTGIDMIVISLADLSSISTEFPKRFHAIRFFVRNSGNLVVFGADPNDRVSELFDQSFDWQEASRINYPRTIHANYDDLSRRTRRTNVPEGVPGMSLVEHGLGKIVAIDSEDPFAISEVHPSGLWQWVMNNIGHDRLSFSSRHGLSLIQNNDDYWDFMVPGYGASPVRSFLGFITLFIIMIGPVNYYLLNQAKRLYLLPVTVGIAAFVTTIAMMGYALVSDGISTRSRLRSYTEIDQRRDEHIASSHCRHAYIASFTPAGGLRFPYHTCVYPVVPSQSRFQRRVEELNDRQETRILESGYMRPRTTMQFISTDVNATTHGIDVARGVSNATNKLGAKLTYAWIRDENGDLYRAENVEVDQAINFSPADQDDEWVAYQKIAGANKPAPPAGLDKTANDWMFGDNNYRRYGYVQSSPPSTETSLLNKSISNVRSFFKQAKPNTYLVISETAPPYIHTGTEASELASFHVTRGVW